MRICVYVYCSLLEDVLESAYIHMHHDSLKPKTFPAI